VLRHARLGARGPGLGEEAGQGQPRRPDAPRGGGLQGHRHQSHLRHDAAPGIP
jgi:hypothetical protein